jgi:hypothetical protein
LDPWVSEFDGIDEAKVFVFIDEGSSAAIEWKFGAELKMGDEETTIELMGRSGAIEESFRVGYRRGMH